MVMPIIIGLPGVGKSAVNTELARQLNIKIISTDEEFRRLRAIGANDNSNPDAIVMNLFIKQVYQDFVLTGKMTPFKFAELQRVCNVDKKDDKGRSGFRDSMVARSFGEDVFRTFEWVMNQWLNDNGHFAGKLVDISSSAPLYPQNKATFSPENGYVPVLLHAYHEVIVGNLVEDFSRHAQMSLEARELVPVRGAYDKVARDALRHHHGYNGSDLNLLKLWGRTYHESDAVRYALSDYAIKVTVERLDKLCQMAAITINMNGLRNDASPIGVSKQIISALNLG